MSRPEPVFEAPWHGQVFALAVHLHARGLFDWPDWTQALGAELAQRGQSKDLNGGEDYFLAWLAVLERICVEKGLAETGALADAKAAWEEAYLTTPHGAPVHLPG